MSDSPLFSFYTCTYNREDTLPRTYDSIRNQTVRDFEWVVYDNGSTDDSLSLLKRWQAEADFPILVMHSPDNTGFQNRYNEALEKITGRFWLELDSDDACVPHTLERFIEIWNSIDESEQEHFAGVTVCCEDQHGQFVGMPFPESPLDATDQELAYKYKIKGEKWGFTRTEVLRQFPAPTSEHHVNPGVIWRAIGRRYKTRFTNDVLRTYYIDEEGRQDQISIHLSGTIHNAYGRRLNSMDSLNNDLKWFSSAPRRFLEHAVMYTCFGNYLDIGIAQQLSDVKPPFGKLLVLLGWPLGKVMYYLQMRKSSTA